MAPEFSPEALHEHRAFLRALAAGLLADEHGADDVVQDAALVWWKSPPRSVEAARTWLARVTHNLALNALRERERRVARERFAARGEELEAEAGLETQQRVLAAVMALREPYKSVVWMRWYEDLPPRAIAARTGRTVETVKSQLKRALAELRERLDAEFGDRRGWTAALLPLMRPRELVPGSGFLLASAALVLVVGVAATLLITGIDVARDESAEAALLAADVLPDEPGPALREHPADLARDAIAERVSAATAGAPTDSESFRGRALDAHDRSPLPELDLVVRFADGSTAAARTTLEGSFAVTQPRGAAVSEVEFLEDEPVAIAASRVVHERAGRVAEYELAIGPTYALEFAQPAGIDERSLVASIELPGRAPDQRVRARVRSGPRPWVRFPRAPRLSLFGAGERSMYVLSLTSDDGLWRALARVHAGDGTQATLVPLAFGPCAAIRGHVRGARGEGVHRDRVRCRAPGGSIASEATCDEMGAYFIGGLTPGPWVLELEGDRRGVERREVELGSGAELEVDWAPAAPAVEQVGLDLWLPFRWSSDAIPVRVRVLGGQTWRTVIASGAFRPSTCGNCPDSGCIAFTLPAGAYEFVPVLDPEIELERPSAQLEVPGGQALFRGRRRSATERVVMRAEDRSGVPLQRFRAHVVLDRLGRGRKVAVELEGEGLVRAARSGAAVFEGIPRGARGWWLVEADGFQSAWGELDEPARHGIDVAITARLDRAWSCRLFFATREPDGSGGRERALRGVHVRTQGGQLLATSLGDGEARLELLYDPGELVLELPGWRVTSWDGFRGGKRSVHLDPHRVWLERNP